MEKDAKEHELIRCGLQVAAYAFMLLAVQLSLYRLLDPELTFSIGELGDDIRPSLIAFTPISVLIEELVLRVIPYFFTVGLYQGWPRFMDLLRHARGPEEARLDVFMTPLFGVLNGFIHMSNVSSGSPLNLVKYFFTHFIGGAYLGAIYLRRGFPKSYATHLLYNMMVFGLTYLPDAFQ